MVKRKFLIRLDDACQTMDREKWERMFSLLRQYGIKPIVGVIPANADQKQMVNDADHSFWEKVRNWQHDGYTIAMHGYDHVYISQDAGMNPFWHKSEFAGVPLEIQREKIMGGGNLLLQHEITPTCFFAPSHTFDKNTLNALRECSDIRIVSDGIALRPYWYEDFCFIPQFSGHCINIPLSGIYTFCFHPNVMNDKAFENLRKFIDKHNKQFTCLADINLSDYGKIRIIDKVLRALFFLHRKLRFTNLTNRINNEHHYVIQKDDPQGHRLRPPPDTVCKMGWCQDGKRLCHQYKTFSFRTFLH